MGNRFLVMAALSGFITVAFGAFAAHGLEASLSVKQMEWIKTGVQYQMFHTIALLALGFFVSATATQSQPKCRQRAVNIIGVLWTLGILGFSGGLYAMAILNTTKFVMIVPMGGTAFLIGWFILFLVAVRSALAKKQGASIE